MVEKSKQVTLKSQIYITAMFKAKIRLQDLHEPTIHLEFKIRQLIGYLHGLRYTMKNHDSNNNNKNNSNNKNNNNNNNHEADEKQLSLNE